MSGPDLPFDGPRPDTSTLVDDAAHHDEPDAVGVHDEFHDRAVDPDAPVVIEDEPVVLDGPGDVEVVTGPEADALHDDGTEDAGAPGEPGPPVDPRMQRRWVDQRRSEGRRRLRIVAGVVVFAVVALLAWVVAHSSLLGMDTVEVHGTSRVDPAAVRTAAAIEDGAPLLFLDDSAVARRVERLPGIASARVSTELPGTVVIDVVERQPVAWADAPAPEKTALLDASGRVIARVVDPPPGLLRLEGVTAGAVGSRVAHADSLRRVDRLPVALRLMTDHLALARGGGAVLVLRAGQGAGQVVLGDAGQTAHKGAVALALLADLSARGEPRAVVDVTVPDAPFVR